MNPFIIVGDGTGLPTIACRDGRAELLRVHAALRGGELDCKLQHGTLALRRTAARLHTVDERSRVEVVAVEL
eukprot:4892206-Prymnesium_polylepis.1